MTQLIHQLPNQGSSALAAIRRTETQLALLAEKAEALKTSNGLSDAQIQVVRNSLTARKLKDFDDPDELYDELVDVWSEVKLLAGALLYEGRMLEIQLEMLRKFLILSDFVSLTIDEIKSAFYLNAAGQEWKTIPHYGKEINGEWVGAVLGEYMKFRNKTWEQHGTYIRAALALSTPEKKKPEAPPDLYWRDTIQIDYQYFLNGRSDYIIGIRGKYNYLRRIGAIQIHSKKAWYKRLAYCIQQLGRSKKAPTDLIAFLKKERDSISHATYRTLVLEVHRMTYLNFFRVMRETAIVSIWQDVDFSPVNHLWT